MSISLTGIYHDDRIFSKERTEFGKLTVFDRFVLLKKNKTVIQNPTIIFI